MKRLIVANCLIVTQSVQGKGGGMSQETRKPLGSPLFLHISDRSQQGE